MNITVVRGQRNKSFKIEMLHIKVKTVQRNDGLLPLKTLLEIL